MATVNLGSIKFKWKGTYSGATAYTVDDVVEYNGSSYICKLASTGNLPTNTTYFDVMSSAGTNGTNGTDVGTVITTQGDLLYRDGSGLQRLGAGTAGQVLQTGGAGANPSWGTLSSDLVRIKTIDASNVSSVDMVNGSNDVVFDGTYASYLLKIIDFYHNGSPSEQQITITTDGGSTFKTTGYVTNRLRSYYSGATYAVSNNTSYIFANWYGADQSASQSRSFSEIHFSRPNITAYPHVWGHYSGAEYDQLVTGFSGGKYQTSTTYNGFRFEQTNGQNFSARLILYGYKS